MLRIVPLEERIVLDATIMAAIAPTINTSLHHNTTAMHTTDTGSLTATTAPLVAATTSNLTPLFPPQINILL